MGKLRSSRVLVDVCGRSRSSLGLVLSALCSAGALGCSAETRTDAADSVNPRNAQPPFEGARSADASESSATPDSAAPSTADAAPSTTDAAPSTTDAAPSTTDAAPSTADAAVSRTNDSRAGLAPSTPIAERGAVLAPRAALLRRISTSTLILKPKGRPSNLVGVAPGDARWVHWLQNALGSSVRVVSARWLDARAGGNPEKLVVSVEKTSEEQIRTALAHAAALPEVKEAESDPLWTLDAIPNDPLYPQQWSLPKINAPEAWDVVSGSPNVVVAVIDSGIDVTHPELSSALWNNPNDPPDGVDNDGNGLVDDSHGWNFAENNSNLKDVHGHGTHVAGIIGAARNNGTGITGVASGVTIMPLKIQAPDFLSASAVVRGIYYAADHGAKVINVSLGGPANFADSRNAIDYALSKGALVFASAGNSSGPEYNYPAIYQNAVAVAALDQSDRRAGFSNYGSWVDISAPGLDILSTIPNDLLGAVGQSYLSGSGTSQATPIVAGVAALVFSQHPSWTPQQVRNQLLSTAQSIASQNPDFVGLLGAGRVDARAAVSAPVSAPRAYVASVHLDEAPGNGNQQVDPGEAARLTLGIHFTTAGTFTAQVASTAPGVTVTNSPVSITALADRVSVAEFGLQVAANVARDLTANLNLTLQSGAGTVTLPIQVQVAPTYAGYELPYADEQALVSLPSGKQMFVSDRIALFPEEPRYDEVYAALRDPNGEFARKVVLSAQLDHNARRPQAVMSPNGDIHVAFYQYVATSDFFAFPAYAYYNAATNTWSATELFTSGNSLKTIGDHNVSIALDSSGIVHMAWVTYTGSDTGVTLMRGSPGQWSTQQYFPYPVAETYDVQLVNTNDGLRLFVRPKPTGSSSREPVMMQRFDAGVWSAPASTQPVSMFDQTQMPFAWNGAAAQFYQGRGTEIVRLSTLSGSAWIDSQSIQNIGGVSFLTGFTALVSPSPVTSFLARPVPETYGSTREIVRGSETTRLPGDRRLLARNPKLFRDESGKLYVFDQEQVPRATLTLFFTTAAYTNYFTNANVSDSAVPTVPTVTGQGVTTPSGGQAIDATWSASHPQGIDTYRVAVGSTPGSDDIVPWQTTTGTSMRLDFGDQRLLPSQRAYVSVKAESNAVFQSRVGFTDGIVID